MPKEKVPAGRAATYGRIMAEIRLQKVKTHRTEPNVGGNIIKFPGYVTTPTSYLTTAKLIVNNVLSTKNKNSSVQTSPTSTLTVPWTDMNI